MIAIVFYIGLYPCVFQISLGCTVENKDWFFFGRSFQSHFIIRSQPEKIMTDQGTEFLNRYFRALMKEQDIELCNTYNETKASIVERIIRTLKTKMYRNRFNSWISAFEIKDT